MISLYSDGKTKQKQQKEGWTYLICALALEGLYLEAETRCFVEKGKEEEMRLKRTKFPLNACGGSNRNAPVDSCV